MYRFNKKCMPISLERDGNHIYFYTLIFLTVLILLSGASCAQRNTVRIGLLSPFSGPHAEMGDLARKGVVLAIEEINSSGGIKGKEVELIYADSEGTPEGVRRGAQRLIDGKVEAVIGPYLSITTAAALEVINQEDVLFFSPSASSGKFEGLDDNLFRLVRSTSNRSMMYADRIAGDYKLRSVSLIWDTNNSAYTEEWKNAFISRFLKLGGSVVEVIPIQAEEEQLFAPSVDKALKGGPGAMVLITDGVTAAFLCQQIRKIDSSIPIFCSEWAGLSPAFITLGGEAVEGVEVLRGVDLDSQAAPFVQFKERFNSRFDGYPDASSVLSYETTTVIIRGLEKKARKESVKEAILREGDFSLLRGPVKINEFGDSNLNYFFSVISDGHYKLLK